MKIPGHYIVYSPKHSSVVSDISFPLSGDFFPPNKTTILKLGPEPNTAAQYYGIESLDEGLVTS